MFKKKYFAITSEMLKHVLKRDTVIAYLLNTASRGDEDINHSVLHQVTDGLAHTAADHIGGYCEENFAFDFGPSLLCQQIFVLTRPHRLNVQLVEQYFLDHKSI